MQKRNHLDCVYKYKADEHFCQQNNVILFIITNYASF